MTPYLEPKFLACLLLKVPGRRLAWELMKKFPPPYSLNSLHVLQTEGMLFKGLAASGNTQRAAAEGLRLWGYYRGEGVFPELRVNWNAAFAVSLRLNREQVGPTGASTPPSPLQCLHASLASVSGFTGFLSFEPSARFVARSAGLEVLPERI